MISNKEKLISLESYKNYFKNSKNINLQELVLQKDNIFNIVIAISSETNQVESFLKSQEEYIGKYWGGFLLEELIDFYLEKDDCQKLDDFLENNYNNFIKKLFNINFSVFDEGKIISALENGVISTSFLSKEQVIFLTNNQHHYLWVKEWDIVFLNNNYYHINFSRINKLCFRSLDDFYSFVMLPWNKRHYPNANAINNKFEYINKIIIFNEENYDNIKNIINFIKEHKIKYLEKINKKYEQECELNFFKKIINIEIELKNTEL